MKRLLTLSAGIEAPAGLGLLLVPSVVVWLLLGGELAGVGIALGRVAGVALLALAVACWLARGDAQSRAARGLVASMVVYNLGVVLILGTVGMLSQPVGVALWPTVVLHLAMAAWCITVLKGEAQMRFITSAVLCVGAMISVPAFAQDKAADTNMQILRDKVKADKKLVVAANMDLTDAEGKAFWPIYDAYQKDLQALNERLKKGILQYADAYNKNALTDEGAKSLTNEALAIDQDELTLRKTYAAKLGPVLPGKKVARYIQIENKIRAAIRYEMAGGIPLVP
jgi:hypothetical protein